MYKYADASVCRTDSNKKSNRLRNLDDDGSSIGSRCAELNDLRSLGREDVAAPRGMDNGAGGYDPGPRKGDFCGEGRIESVVEKCSTAVDPDEDVGLNVPDPSSMVVN